MRTSEPITRAAATGALLAALVVVVVVLLSSGATHTIHARFQDGGGVVVGDLVLIGPGKVGSVTGVALSPDGQADITLQIDGSAWPLHDGTTAHINQNSLSGIANLYVTLVPGPPDQPKLPDGGVIPADRTFSTVGLDELFDTFDPLTRTGLQQLVRGEGASLAGRGAAANRTLQYLAPALSSTADVTGELSRDQPAFDGLLVKGAAALQTLGAKAQALSDLVSHTDTATGAIARQGAALQQALALLPGALTHSTSTFAGLRSTLDSLDPVVKASLPATRRLAPFATALRALLVASTPTLTRLAGLIHNPLGSGDLTALAQAAPGLERIAAVAIPRAIETMDKSQNQLDSLRVYTPDVVAALTNIGQVSAYYDANGHYARTQPDFLPFGLDPLANQLVSTPGYDRLTGVQAVHGRCPGGATQASPDGSAPWLVPGCTLSSTPPGP